VFPARYAGEIMLPGSRDPRVAGLILAAGAGTRFGGPKGLARGDDGVPWVVRAVRALREGGCDDVRVAVGAAADEVTALLPEGATAVRVEGWADGLSASLAAGLGAVFPGAVEGRGTASDPTGVVIVTVDTPDLPPAAVARVIAAGSSSAALVQATYGGRPGHPVLIGRAHIAAVLADVRGDRGAGPFLAANGADRVECADLWPGLDLDRR
jgi:CTP:molybdopterin cytidylyltransferase MocA